MDKIRLAVFLYDSKDLAEDMFIVKKISSAVDLNYFYYT